MEQYRETLKSIAATARALTNKLESDEEFESLDALSMIAAAEEISEAVLVAHNQKYGRKP